DQQCSEGFLCVPETYRTPSGDADAAAPEPTGMNYCMRRVSPPATTCNLRRPFIGQHQATSEGGIAGTYCRPRYTTCAAYSMHGNGPDVIPESEEGAGLATCFNND